MTPRLAMNDAPDVRLTHPQAGGDLALAHPFTGETFYFDNSLGRQFGRVHSFAFGVVPLSLASFTVHVIEVLGLRSPKQMASIAARRVVASMKCLMLWRWGLAMFQFAGQATRPLAFSIDSQITVSAIGLRARPWPAVVGIAPINPREKGTCERTIGFMSPALLEHGTTEFADAMRLGFGHVPSSLRCGAQ